MICFIDECLNKLFSRSIAIDPLHPQVCVKNKSHDYRSGTPVTSNLGTNPNDDDIINGL